MSEEKTERLNQGIWQTEKLLNDILTLRLQGLCTLKFNLSKIYDIK